MHGPLGPELVMATINLIARGFRLVVSKNDLKAHPAANQGHAASCASMPSPAPAAPPPAPAAPAAWLPTASVPLEVHQAIKTLRAQFVHFLKAKVQEMDGLHFNALIEDGHLSAAFLDAKNRGQDRTAILDMALKAECDSGPGHVCYSGPIATEFFRDALGLEAQQGVVEQESLKPYEVATIKTKRQGQPQKRLGQQGQQAGKKGMRNNKAEMNSNKSQAYMILRNKKKDKKGFEQQKTERGRGSHKRG